MTTQHFRLTSEEKRGLAMHAISEAPEGYEAIIRPFEKTRSLAANSFHWASLTEYLRQINQIVSRISDNTGYTPLEVKREIARTMQPEHIAILYARTPETAHDVLKEVCGIPTSTRLGTKKFHEFDETMETTMAQIIGEVMAFEGVANG